MDELQNRANERKIYEEVVDMVVNFVYSEYSSDEAARLRIYAKVAENFKGMVDVLTPAKSRIVKKVLDVENGEIHDG